MASKIDVPVSTTQGNSPSLTSPTCSLPIRAPITVDDFQSDGYKSDTSDSNISSRSGTSNNTDNGFVSGEEEFDTAPERSFLGAPDEENSEEGVFGGIYRVSMPFVADPDEEILALEEEEEEEESGVTDEFSPVVELDSAKSNGVRPIAQLSMDDDEFDKVTGYEGMVGEVEDGRFLGVVKVPSFGAQESVDAAPLVKVLDIEEDKEVGLFFQSNFSFDDNQSGLSTERDSEADSGVLCPKDAIVSNGSVNDTGSVKLVVDSGQDATVIQLTNMLWKAYFSII